MAVVALRLPPFVPPVIGVPGEADVPALIALINTLVAEHSQLFIHPVDPVSGVATLRAHLAAIAGNGAEAVLVARDGAELVGLITGTRGSHPARFGTVDIGLGVLRTHRDRGIGFALLAALECWARGVGCHRLQLHVVVGNTPAIALYRKAGFDIEGMLKATAMVDGHPLDELQMAKLLEPVA
ncbi:MAG TPA: GNAT family N-acetyltransferase [Stellaceae bacterium]|jgi:RimJ/RimL family protein N-acetyltransferase